MRALLTAVILLTATCPLAAGETDPSQSQSHGFLDFSPPPEGYTGGLGLVTAIGPSGMFQNSTSGILPKNAFSVQSCMAFRNPENDHFEVNGVSVAYGITDFLEIGGYGLFVHDLDPVAAGTDELKSGQINGRIRLIRDEGAMPEVSVGALGQWGDAPLETSAVYIAASKGFALSDGPVLRSFRVHAGFRQEWNKLGSDVSTGYGGLEIEIFRGLFAVGEINTKDDSYAHTPWSAGLQYRGNGFGLTAAALQTPSDNHLTAYVGIGVSY